MDRSGHRKNLKRDGMEMGEKKKEKVINFANSTLLDYPPPLRFQPLFEFVIVRARPQNYSNGWKNGGARDKIEGRPVTDLMAARLSILPLVPPITRWCGGTPHGRKEPSSLNFNLSGPFIWPLFKSDYLPMKIRIACGRNSPRFCFNACD